MRFTRRPIFIIVATHYLISLIIYWVVVGRSVGLAAEQILSAPLRDLALFLSHTTGLFLAQGLAVLGLATLIGSLRPKLGTNVIAVVVGCINTLAAVLTIVDYKTYQTIGIHLYSTFETQSSNLSALWREAKVNMATALTLAAVIALIAVGQVVLYRIGRVYDEREAGYSRGRTWIALLIAVALGGGLSQAAHEIGRDKDTLDPELIDAMLLYKQLHFGQVTQEHFDVRYPHVEAPIFSDKPNVLFVLAESLRSDVLADGLAPNIAKFADSPDCLHSDAHYANNHATQFGVFASLYGLYPHLYDAFQAADIAPQPLRMLKDQGYRIVGASASEILTYAGAGFAFKSFDEYRQFTARDDYRDDGDAVSWLNGKVGQRSSPTFEFIFFNSTHYNYTYPPDRETFKPVVNRDYNQLLEDYNDDATRVGVRNRYRNSVTWVDYLVGQMLEARRKEWEAGQLIVFASGDHGEEFWDKGAYGHGAARFIDARLRVPFIMCRKGSGWGTRPPLRLSAHVDVMPTLFEALGADRLPAVFDGHSLLSQVEDPWTLAIGSGFPGRNMNATLITPGRKIWLKKPTKKIDVFRVEGVVGPTDDRIEDADGADLLAPYQDRISAALRRFTSLESSD